MSRKSRHEGFHIVTADECPGPDECHWLRHQEVVERQRKARNFRRAIWKRRLAHFIPKSRGSWL